MIKTYLHLNYNPSGANSHGYGEHDSKYISYVMLDFLLQEINNYLLKEYYSK
jgi:hypothetical protein